VLKTTEKLLIDRAEKLKEVSPKYIRAEIVYKLTRAKVQLSASVRDLPNQAQRDAEADVVMSEHPEQSKIQDEYLNLKADNRKAWIDYEVATELNKNARALLISEGEVQNGKDEVRDES
jgi:hypothetical protein